METTDSYAKSVSKSNSIADNLNKNIVFGGSIIRGINNSCTGFIVFLAANSKELLHYIDPILENWFDNEAAPMKLHKKSPGKCRKSPIKFNQCCEEMSGACNWEDFYLQLALSRRTFAATIKNVNEKTASLCKENVENTNTLNSHWPFGNLGIGISASASASAL